MTLLALALLAVGVDAPAIFTWLCVFLDLCGLLVVVVGTKVEER